MDLRGMPLSVVQAAVAALQEGESLKEWVAAYPYSDSDLLTDLAPVVEASIAAWLEYRALAEECEKNGGHELEVLSDETGPVGIFCSHCTSSWAVAPAPTVPSPDGDAPAGGDPPEAHAPIRSADADAEPPAATHTQDPDARTAKRAGPRAATRAVTAPRPERAAEPAADVAPPSVVCACGRAVDEGDKQLAKANSAISGDPICRACMLTCEQCKQPIDTLDQAVLTAMRYRERLDAKCMKEKSGAA